MANILEEQKRMRDLTAKENQMNGVNSQQSSFSIMSWFKGSKTQSTYS